jgi:hypothetical protein
MPMFTMARMGLPVNPVHVPARTPSAKAAMRSRTSCTSATTFRPSTTIVASRGARSATWSTDRFSVTLMRSPRNIAAMRSRRPTARARSKSFASVSDVTRCFE